MHKDDLDAYQIQKNNVLNDRFFEHFAHHCIAAVLYHDNLAGIFLDIRQRFHQYSGPRLRG